MYPRWWPSSLSSHSGGGVARVLLCVLRRRSFGVGELRRADVVRKLGASVEREPSSYKQEDKGG